MWVWSNDTLSIQDKAIELFRTIDLIYECKTGCSSRECMFCCCCLISLFVVFVCFVFMYSFYRITTVAINSYYILTPSMSTIKHIQWGGAYDLLSPFCTRFVFEKEVLLIYHTHYHIQLFFQFLQLKKLFGNSLVGRLSYFVLFPLGKVNLAMFCFAGNAIERNAPKATKILCQIVSTQWPDALG